VKATYEHECPCSADVFWSGVIMDDDFDRRLFLEGLGFEAWELVTQHETPSEIRRVVRGVPKLDVPEAFRSYLKRGLGFRETDVLDKRTRTARAVVTPTSASRRISISVKLHATPRTETSCVCRYEVAVVASLFTALGGSSIYGISGVVEQEILSHIIRGCELRAAFTRRFIEEKGLTGAI
jgi:hypothetical protein